VSIKNIISRPDILSIRMASRWDFLGFGIEAFFACFTKDVPLCKEGKVCRKKYQHRRMLPNQYYYFMVSICYRNDPDNAGIILLWW